VVYGYPSEHYELWRQELAINLGWGAFKTSLKSSRFPQYETAEDKPTEVVREVTVSDPAVIAERDALKSAIDHLARFSRFDDFRKIEAVVDLFASDPVASKALANVFRVRFDDVKSLMAKSTSELKTFRDAYRSPLAPVAQAIIVYRITENAKAEYEKNSTRLAVEI